MTRMQARNWQPFARARGNLLFCLDCPLGYLREDMLHMRQVLHCCGQDGNAVVDLLDVPGMVVNGIAQ